MSKTKTIYICQNCGYKSPKWLGKCPDCGSWNSLVEEIISDSHISSTIDLSLDKKILPQELASLETESEDRIKTGIKELDRVLGGGLVRSSTILLAGEPGIGKSTLLLQMLFALSKTLGNVLYISGEESVSQIKLRAIRLGKIPKGLWVVSENQLEIIEAIIKKLSPSIIAIDSIQTMSVKDLNSAPGSISQVRESSSRLIKIAKDLNIPVIMVGHVTKGGEIAGPRVLEHMVDVVLYFEGERYHAFRILRGIKNRFGATFEIGIFEMSDTGLKEVGNPSEILMGAREDNVSGSVILPIVQGTRPILVEIQALVSPSHLTMPRRTTTGFDVNRLAMLLAVAERHLRIVFYDADVFINVVGGIKIQGTEADLAVISALISSLKDVPIKKDTAIFGEVGLTGEIRALSKTQLRIDEASRIGIKRIILPYASSKGLKAPPNTELVFIRHIKELRRVI